MQMRQGGKKLKYVLSITDMRTLFPWESVSGRVLKTGQHFAKIKTKNLALFFSNTVYKHMVISTTTKYYTLHKINTSVVRN